MGRQVAALCGLLVVLLRLTSGVNAQTEILFQVMHECTDAST